MLNYLPIIGQAAQLAAELFYSSISDYFGKRLPFLLLHSVRDRLSTLHLGILLTGEDRQYHIFGNFNCSTPK